MGDGARGEEGNAAFASEPFSLPREMIIRLYETDSKDIFVEGIIYESGIY